MPCPLIYYSISYNRELERRYKEYILSLEPIPSKVDEFRELNNRLLVPVFILYCRIIDKVLIMIIGYFVVPVINKLSLLIYV